MELCTSIKCDLRCCFHIRRVLVERAIGIVSLLLDCRSKLQEAFGHGLVGAFQNIDQAA